VEGVRRFAVLLVVLALVVRLAVPTGWMPGEKSFQLTLCTGFDTETVWMDSEGRLHKQKPHSEGEQKPCAFGGALAFAGPADFATMPEPLLPVEAARLSAAHVSIGQGLAAPPPPQTGPPFLI
jgi:hypothetical protein